MDSASPLTLAVPDETTALSREEIERYSRHLIMPEVGMAGQRRLKAAKVLVIGTGGLGAPVSLYLTAAGIGKLGLVDFDRVDVTNLQRQILFSTAEIGKRKTEAARDRLIGLNPKIEIQVHDTRLTSENALDIIRDYDLIIDGTDSFPTRYLVNDACVLLGKPNVYASIFRFEGQVSVFWAENGPCYRCLYPEPPPPGLVPSCAEGGVLGVLPGIVGALQTTEAVKLILGTGEPLIGRLLLFDALAMQTRNLKIHKKTDCPVCGQKPTIKELIDYEQFCGLRGEETDTVNHNKVAEISVETLKEKIDRGDPIEIVDVREPHEFEICRIPKSKMIPLGQVGKRLSELNPSDELIVHCRSGVRSKKAVKLLQKNGFKKTFNLKGGILAWADKIDPTMPKY